MMILALVLAVLTVELKDILYSILSFCGMCIILGVIFWILNAPYVAVFQMLVYAGAIVAMFIAAVMLTTRKERLG
ncbi:short chain dehydrogenase [Candidatus Bathyarchaeota archaeon]|nr:MAG: short chain dehydrogenase [Candidatus Bathyarchaeota archaeon]